MKHRDASILPVLLALLCWSNAAFAQGDASTLDDAWVAAITYQPGENRQALRRIEMATLAATADEGRQREIERRLLDLLAHDDATRACRAFACRQLAVVGGQASIAPLIGLLGDADMAHMARYALQVIPGAGATNALREAARHLDGELRSGVTTSLMLRSDDFWSWPLVTIELSLAAESMEYARSLLVRGDRDGAIRQYRRLFEATPAGARDDGVHLRYAALQAWNRLAPEETSQLVLDLLAGDDSYWRGSAARVIVHSPDPAATLIYAERLGRLAPSAQALLVGALAERGDRAAAGSVAALVDSADAAVGEAAVRALGDIGDARQVPLLIGLAAGGSAAAGASLDRVRAEGVDDTLLLSIPDASIDERVVIARTLGVRRAHRSEAALAALAAADQPSSVRTAALIALSQLHDPRSRKDANDLYAASSRAAARPEERRWVLADLADRGTFRQVHLPLLWLDDAEVAVDAARVAVALARLAPEQERDVAREVVDRVVAAHGDAPEIRGLAGDALSHLERNQGFVTEWMVAGPYRQDGLDGRALFDVAFAPEPGAKSDDLEWKRVKPEAILEPGVVDLLRVIGGNDRAAYLLTMIRSDEDRAARLEIGSDDGVKVWLNGKLVHANDAMRGLTAGEDKFPVTLQRGSNFLVLKINQGGGDWRACCRIRDPDGFQLKGIRITAPSID